MSNRSLIWRRDVGLYFAIGFLTVWQGFQFQWTREAVLTALLGGLLPLKGKLSNGNPKDDQSELQ